MRRVTLRISATAAGEGAEPVTSLAPGASGSGQSECRGRDIGGGPYEAALGVADATQQDYGRGGGSGVVVEAGGADLPGRGSCSGVGRGALSLDGGGGGGGGFAAVAAAGCAGALSGAGVGGDCAGVGSAGRAWGGRSCGRHGTLVWVRGCRNGVYPCPTAAAGASGRWSHGWSMGLELVGSFARTSGGGQTHASGAGLCSTAAVGPDCPASLAPLGLVGCW
ncbi:hypothetical protein PLESTB_001101400 [Pleodorina starrii]|uniref:Uncharacterized protein n=1 Tax=Pleodorina starrii TaxID=330485 RepID=A0A9W6BRX6_9CHLO|nr:hypothetical protein PLESTB_001101400 [Pleodorina starrii]